MNYRFERIHRGATAPYPSVNRPELDPFNNEHNVLVYNEFNYL